MTETDNVWEMIKTFNSQFSYEREDELQFWRQMLQRQVDEIDNHLQEGEQKKAVNEFMDCILVSQQAIIKSGRDPDVVAVLRMEDVEGRLGEVMDNYDRL